MTGSPLKILFICHRMPYPPSDGARVRAFHIIRHLSRSHQVTVASPVRSEQEVQGAEQLKEHCCEVITGPIGRGSAVMRMVGNLATLTPSSMGYFHSPALARKIRQVLASRHFDLVFVYCSSVAHYVENVRAENVRAENAPVDHDRTLPRVIDFVDMDSQKWLVFAKAHRFPLSLGYWLEGVKLQRAEARIARTFDLSLCVTPGELETLRGYGVGTQTGWFPNGVDLDYFAPVSEPYDPNGVCFVGRMDYFPNQQAAIDFCDHVLPRVRQSRPDVTFTIVGAEPTRAVRQLAERPGVTVTGTVADVRAFVRRSALSVAPLKYARGVQNKILESMAMGVPVVASRETAKGVDAIPGEHLLVVTDADAMADAVLRLLCDPEERRRLSRAGRAHVEKTYSWETAMRQMDHLLQEMGTAR